jgi:NADH:ubiquinone reductase (H+-translocating)
VDRSVTLVAPGDDLVIRPRLYQADPGKMRVPLDGILGPIGVRREAAAATGIDTERRRVTVTGRNGEVKELAYERLVLATGSRLVRPDLPGAEHLHDVDTLEAAVALEEHLHALPRRPPRPGRFTAVVVGAGFTGLEVATELVGRLRAIADEHGVVEKVRVVLVEQTAAVGPELGPGPRPVISEALDLVGVERYLGVTLRSVHEYGVVRSNGTELAAHTVIWTAGTQAARSPARSRRNATGSAGW